MRALFESKKMLNERPAMVIGDNKFLINNQKNILISNRYD